MIINVFGVLFVLYEFAKMMLDDEKELAHN